MVCVENPDGMKSVIAEHGSRVTLNLELETHQSKYHSQERLEVTDSEQGQGRNKQLVSPDRSDVYFPRQHAQAQASILLAENDRRRSQEELWQLNSICWTLKGYSDW